MDVNNLGVSNCRTQQGKLSYKQPKWHKLNVEKDLLNALNKRRKIAASRRPKSIIASYGRPYKLYKQP